MRCPVCQARFRGTRLCSRCGADLTPLMLLALKAWRLREAARGAIAAGDVERAAAYAQAAQGTQNTKAGEALRALSGWLSFARGNVGLCRDE